jgi:hypothetical protein
MDLVHPLVRGQDIQRWTATPSAHLLFVQDPVARRGIDEAEMVKRYPGALEYLGQFEAHLRSRAAFRRYFRRTNSAKQDIETGPYWSMFNVGRYTLAPHKVVWKYQASDFAAAVLERADPLVLPNDRVIFVPCDDIELAYFVCGALNSVPVRAVVAAHTVETQLSAHIVRTLAIPAFEVGNRKHMAVVEASRAAHAAVAAGEEPDQAAVDRTAGRLWGLTKGEVTTSREFLDQLLKRDLRPA